MTFKQWMQEVDDIVWATVGCSIYDLADAPFLDWYEDKVTPRIAAARAIAGG